VWRSSGRASWVSERTSRGITSSRAHHGGQHRNTCGGSIRSTIRPRWIGDVASVLLQVSMPHFYRSHECTQSRTAHRTALHRTAPHRKIFCTAPHLTSPHLTSPHRTAPHRTAPHRTAPHRTAPHRTAPRPLHTLGPWALGPPLLTMATQPPTQLNACVNTCREMSRSVTEDLPVRLGRDVTGRAEVRADCRAAPYLHACLNRTLALCRVREKPAARQPVLCLFYLSLLSDTSQHDRPGWPPPPHSTNDVATGCGTTSSAFSHRPLHHSPSGPSSL
jgi:hypothetical protein